VPVFFERLSYIDPLRHLVQILRGIYLNCIGLEVFWPHAVAMGFLALLLLSVSGLLFRKSLE
jgi:ABC-2 type transport system permease protein